MCLFGVAVVFLLVGLVLKVLGDGHGLQAVCLAVGFIALGVGSLRTLMLR